MSILDTLKSKHLDRWLPGYGRHLLRSRFFPKVSQTRHLLFALCDHYEPLWGPAEHQTGLARVQTWRDDYPKLAKRYRDADGYPPRHSFFFPGEEYHPAYFELLEELVAQRMGEIELHLHHDNSTEASLKADIERYLAIYAERGHLPRAPDGKIRYAFIHGNWALANARPDGKNCGVDAELPLLFETGCYADFTFPSVPDVSQPNIVNQIYWPVGDISRRRAYEQGEAARVGKRYQDRILMMQGPLGLSRRPGRASFRIEYGALTAHDPASEARVASWVKQNIHIAERPEWVFVKVYTHGAPERQAARLLGDGGVALHDSLAQYNDGQRWKLHYVTAREMYNIAQAAMSGEEGDPNAYRDYQLPPPPISSSAEAGSQSAAR